MESVQRGCDGRLSPSQKALIIKVNALLLRRGDDTHTWLKIDASRRGFYGKYFPFDPFFSSSDVFLVAEADCGRKQKKILLRSSEKFFCTTHFQPPEASYRQSTKFCHSRHNLISRANNCYLFFGSFLRLYLFLASSSTSDFHLVFSFHFARYSNFYFAFYCVVNLVATARVQCTFMREFILDFCSL